MKYVFFNLSLLFLFINGCGDHVVDIKQSEKGTLKYYIEGPHGSIYIDNNQIESSTYYGNGNYYSTSDISPGTYFLFISGYYSSNDHITTGQNIKFDINSGEVTSLGDIYMKKAYPLYSINSLGDIKFFEKKEVSFALDPYDSVTFIFDNNITNVPDDWDLEITGSFHRLFVSEKLGTQKNPLEHTGRGYYEIISLPFSNYDISYSCLIIYNDSESIKTINSIRCNPIKR